MAIPDYQTLMLPLLEKVSDGQKYRTRDLIDSLSNEFNLSEKEKRELLPSGQQPIIDNRIGWAKTYLYKAGLLSVPKRGYVEINQKGLNVLKKKPKKINIKFLEQFPEFNKFRTIKKEASKKPIIEFKKIENSTPDELIERGYSSINVSLAQELIEKLRNVDPYFFEEIIGKLLSSMGYGKFKKTTFSRDKGVDGIVYQDKLGLDKIFFQAKRYSEENFVAARDVRDFVGTLDLHGANKGIFITTSKFPKDTNDILKKTQKNIILIDGPKLANLMIEYDTGVSVQKIYKIKKIDTDFFPED